MRKIGQDRGLVADHAYPLAANYIYLFGKQHLDAEAGP
jgi:hypothetical protein